MNMSAPQSSISLLSRRTMIQLGALGLAAHGTAKSVGAKPAAKNEHRSRRDTACIMFFLDGGPSHHETFDPKPEAPAEVRGEFGAIETSVPGLRITDQLPLLARQAEHFAVVRSLHHGNNSHAPAEHQMLTGRMGTRGGTRRAVIETPSFGSITSRLRGTRRPGMPAYVGIPWSFHHEYIGSPFGAAAYLGSRHEPFESGHLAASASEPFTVPILELREGLSHPRLRQRQQLLAQLDQFRQQGRSAQSLQQTREFTNQGMDLLLQRHVRDAFDLARESPSLRERYGPHEWGQGALLARRLVEAGVTFTLIQCGLRQDWDTHNTAFPRLKKLLPPLDRAVATLIADLAERGLLAKTLVMVIGEFGRTPKVGQITTGNQTDSSGRDHWAHCFSALVAGGGLKMGQVIGASDTIGGYPISRPSHAQDLFATMYHVLGIYPHTVFIDRQNRPIPVLSHGTPIEGLV